MKNKWFYPGLFRESLRQLRVIGIIAFVILEIGALCLGASHLLEAMSIEEYYRLNMEEVGRTLLDVMSVSPLLLAVPFLLAPIMTLYLFSHLNKRNAGDFYHALPCTRQAMFLSQLAAIVVWVTAILLLNAATSVLVVLCLGKYYAINLTAVAVMTFNCFAASLLVIGGVALAMSMTGTLLTNVVASVLVLFGPRVLLFFATMMLGLPTISREHLLGVLDPPYNLVSHLIISMVQGAAPAVINFLPGGLYTLVLSVGYAALALWAFCRRHSESAGHSAGSKLMQTAFRLAVTMLICLIPCGVILTCVSENYVDSSRILGIVVCYVLALIAYFLYELITTKKLRNLLKAMPMLGAVAVLNVALIFGVIGIEQMLLHRDIAASDVSSVSLEMDGRYWSGDTFWGEENYFAQKESEIKYTDKEAIKLLADGFTKNNRLLRQSESKFNQTFIGNATRHLVRFTMKNGTEMYRYVYLDGADQKALLERIFKNEELRKVYLELPDLDGVGNTCDISGLTAEQSSALYEVMRNELKTLDFETWYRYLNDSNGHNKLDVTVWINYTLGVNNTRTTFDLPLMLSETCKQYLATYQETNPDAAQKLATAFRTHAKKHIDHKIDYSDGMISYVDLNIFPVLGDTDDAIYSIGLWEDNEFQIKYDVEAIADLLDTLAKKPAAEAGPLYHLSLTVSDAEKFWDYEAYVAMPDGKVDPLLATDAYILAYPTDK